MPVLDVFKSLQESAIGSAVSSSTWMFPTIETVHVIAVASVVGSIVAVDLRLIGAASRERPVTAVTHDFLPWTWGAFAVAVASGLLMFVSRAGDYMAVPAFLAKFGLMAVAAANMLVFHLATQRSIARWDLGPPPAAARLAGGASLVLWALIVVCGRKVGFSL